MVEGCSEGGRARTVREGSTTGTSRMSSVKNMFSTSLCSEAAGTLAWLSAFAYTSLQ